MLEPEQNDNPIFRAIAISRLRLVNDGAGVTTLVAAYGCPLRCRYCLNPRCFHPDGPAAELTVDELIRSVRIDDLYFQATGGGIVFGGGEPLLYADFIHAFKEKCPAAWKIGLESSLAVDNRRLAGVIRDIDFYIIDIKDMNPAIYREYTGKDNDIVIDNLRFLIEHVPADDIRIRIPLIPGFNTEADRAASRKLLEEMGYTRFDLFRYDVRRAKEKAEEQSR